MKIYAEGMMCMGCVARVTRALESLGAREVKVDLATKEISFEGVDLALAIESIDNLGYEIIEK